MSFCCLLRPYSYEYSSLWQPYSCLRSSRHLLVASKSIVEKWNPQDSILSNSMILHLPASSSQESWKISCASPHLSALKSKPSPLASHSSHSTKRAGGNWKCLFLSFHVICCCISRVVSCSFVAYSGVTVQHNAVHSMFHDGEVALSPLSTRHDYSVCCYVLCWHPVTCKFRVGNRECLQISILYRKILLIQ